MELWKIVADIAFHVILPLTMPGHATFVPNLMYYRISIPVVHRHISGISLFIVSKQEPQHPWKTG